MRKDDCERCVGFIGKWYHCGDIVVKHLGGGTIMNQLGVVAWLLIDWSGNIRVNGMGVVTYW
jgi:hypothetical protein